MPGNKVEWLARGKYPVGIGVRPEERGQFKKLGAPLKTIKAVEGAPVTGGMGGVLLINKAPHPDAATLFINWLLSKEGMVAMSRVTATETARVDIPTDFLDPETIRQPGVKYFSQISPAFEVKKRDYMELSKEIFKASLQ